MFYIFQACCRKPNIDKTMSFRFLAYVVRLNCILSRWSFFFHFIYCDEIPFNCVRLKISNIFLNTISFHHGCKHDFCLIRIIKINNHVTSFSPRMIGNYFIIIQHLFFITQCTILIKRTCVAMQVIRQFGI